MPEIKIGLTECNASPLPNILSPGSLLVMLERVTRLHVLAAAMSACRKQSMEHPIL